MGVVATELHESQRAHCSNGHQGPYPMEQFGMGSNLHRWSLALCHAMKMVSTDIESNFSGGVVL
jgi:hypothetical protein